MDNTPDRRRNRGMTLSVATSSLDSPGRIENKNYARARGLTVTNNGVAGTPGNPITPGTNGLNGLNGFLNGGNGVGENVLNNSNVLDGPNSTYGLNGDNEFNGTTGTNSLNGGNSYNGGNGTPHLNVLSERLLRMALTPTASGFGANGLGANDFTGLSSGLQQTVNAFQQSYPYLPPGLTPDSPITPAIPLSQILGMSMELGRTYSEIQHLKSRIQEFEDKEKNSLKEVEDKEENTLKEAEEKHPSKGGHQSNVLNTPSSHRRTPKSVRNIRSGNIALSNTSAVGVRPKRSENDVFGPSSPATPRTPHGPAKMKFGSGRSGRKGHNRNNTPEQIIAGGELAGVPIFTIGIDPQDIRGLINDFIDEIKKWAFKWAFQGELSPEDLEALTSHDAILEFLRNASAIYPLIADQYLRCALVAAIVSRDIVYNGLSDHFLYNSQHPDAAESEAVISKYEKPGPTDKATKHKLLYEQKAIYTKIKGHPGHREWRTGTAKIFSEVLIDKLKGLIINNEIADRDHALHELYIKGYRIGFRFRMEAMKWQMAWPSNGDEFNAGRMVNESRTLCGDILTTVRTVTQNPQNYAVRFATSPTIRRFDFSSGTEHESIMHKALVHISKKPQAIGTERGYGLSSSPTK